MCDVLHFKMNAQKTKRNDVIKMYTIKRDTQINSTNFVQFMTYAQFIEYSKSNATQHEIAYDERTFENNEQ